MIQVKPGSGAGIVAEGIAELSDGFDSGANGAIDRPAVGDARAPEIDQAWLGWRGERAAATAGRQRIVFDNQRFIPLARERRHDSHLLNIGWGPATRACRQPGRPVRRLLAGGAGGDLAGRHGKGGLGAPGRVGSADSSSTPTTTATGGRDVRKAWLQLEWSLWAAGRGVHRAHTPPNRYARVRWIR